MHRALVSGAAVLALCGCATPATSRKALPTDASLSDGAARAEAVRLAESLVGQRRPAVEGHPLGGDCTGLVRAVYTRVGVDLLSAARPHEDPVAAIYRFAQLHGQLFRGGPPSPGDLVFL